MRQRIAKADANQPEIVKCFRDLGWSVLHIHQLSNCADIVVSKAISANCPYCDGLMHERITILVEIKDGSLSPSRRKLTDGEEKFAKEWQGYYCIVENIDDVLKTDEDILFHSEPIRTRYKLNPDSH